MTSVIAITLMLSCGSATDCVELPTAAGGVTRLQPDVKMTLQEQDLAEFKLVYNEYDQPSLMIALEPEAQSRLAGLTTEHVGENLALVVEGKVVSEPRITAPITQGRLQLTPGAGGDARPFWEGVPWMMEKLGLARTEAQAATRRNSAIYVVAAAVLLLGCAGYLLWGRRPRKKLG